MNFYQKFYPKIKQTDKRDRDSAVLRGERFVEKNFCELALPSFVSVNETSSNRAVQNVKFFYPPNSPMDRFWNAQENKPFVKQFTKAMIDTGIFALDLWDSKETDEENGTATFYEKLGLSQSENSANAEDEPPMPEIPILCLSAEKCSIFYASFLKFLYKKEGKSKVRLWAKKSPDGSVVCEATKLAMYDDVAERILPRSQYIGRGSGGPNIGRRMQLVIAYLMKKLGLDYNEHCEKVPDSYRPVELDFLQWKELVSEEPKKDPRKKSRKQKALAAAASLKRNIQDYEDDDRIGIIKLLKQVKGLGLLYQKLL